MRTVPVRFNHETIRDYRVGQNKVSCCTVIDISKARQ